MIPGARKFLSRSNCLLLRHPMTRTNKALQRQLADVGDPTNKLKRSEVIGKLVKAIGNSQHEFMVAPSHWERVEAHFGGDKKECPNDSDRTIVVSMPPKFRNTMYVRRGGLVVVELYEKHELDDQARVKGDIANIVRNQKEWEKYEYWPVEFKAEPQNESGRFDFLQPSDSEEN